LAAGVTGCGVNEQFRSNGLPAKKYLVGGGLSVEWIAPCNGTAHLVEETTSKIIQCQYLEQGKTFETSMNLDPVEFKEYFGIEIGEAKLSLYFIPTNFKSDEN
jgi:hypothetical protein